MRNRWFAVLLPVASRAHTVLAAPIVMIVTTVALRSNDLDQELVVQYAHGCFRCAESG